MPDFNAKIHQNRFRVKLRPRPRWGERITGECITALCCRPLVGLIKGQVISVQMKAALAVDAIADHNENCQAAFLAHNTGSALLRLLKVF